MTEAERESALRLLMADPLYRLTSGKIYKIAPADGKSGIIPFTPWDEQKKLYRAMYERRRKKIVFLKARRPGGSTSLGIDMLDTAIFVPGSQGSLVDQTAGDAARKMDRIIGVALDNLPEWVKKDIRIIKRNESHLSLSYKGGSPSDIYAGMDARGGSNDKLWISEYGVIQFEDPKRSARIRSGALPSARHGTTIIETTWAGGKSGDLWELIEPVLSRAADDWEIMFCPWWADPRNVDDTAVIDETAKRYFEKAMPRFREMGINISERQMRWWAKEKRDQGLFMSRENPSWLEECWSAPVQGSIYGESIERARADGRVCSMPVDGRSLVFTAWDLGAPRQTRVIYFQVVGEWIHIIDCDPVTDETIVQRVQRMKQKGYAYGGHYFPHDALQTERSGKTLATEFAAAWLGVAPEYIGSYDALTGQKSMQSDYRKCGLRFVPRTQQKWVGINYGLQMFPGIKFRDTHCQEMLATLALYRTPSVKEGGNDTGEPIHDHSSHLADAFRTLAEARQHNMIEVSSPIPLSQSKFDRIWNSGRQGIPGLSVRRGPSCGLLSGR